MVDVEDSIVVDRSLPFVPDEIFFLNFVVTNFKPIPPRADIYSKEEFDNKVKKDAQAIRVRMMDELKKEEITVKERGARINAVINDFKLEKAADRPRIVQQREEELIW